MYRLITFKSVITTLEIENYFKSTHIMLTSLRYMTLYMNIRNSKYINITFLTCLTYIEIPAVNYF